MKIDKCVKNIKNVKFNIKFSKHVVMLICIVRDVVFRLLLSL